LATRLAVGAPARRPRVLREPDPPRRHLRRRRHDDRSPVHRRRRALPHDLPLRLRRRRPALTTRLRRPSTLGPTGVDFGSHAPEIDARTSRIRYGITSMPSSASSCGRALAPTDARSSRPLRTSPIIGMLCTPYSWASWGSSSMLTFTTL